MDDAQRSGQEGGVIGGGVGRCGDDGEFRGVDAGSDGPEVQVGEAIVGVGFDGEAEGVGDFGGGFHIEQDAAGGSQQADGPADDEEGAENADGGIEPRLAGVFPGGQRGDSQDRGQSVGQDVQVSGQEVLILLQFVGINPRHEAGGFRGVGGIVMMVVGMVGYRRINVGVVVMMTVVRVFVAAAEDDQAQGVDGQADNGDENRLIEFDGNGGDEAFDAFGSHERREEGQQHGGGEGGERVDLAGAEIEAGIAGAAAGVEIGEGGDRQGGGVRAHVQPVGEQRHRAEEQPGGDLDGHHDGGNGDDDQRPPFPRPRHFLTEGVFMPPAFDRLGVHKGLQSKRWVKNPPYIFYSPIILTRMRFRRRPSNS
jgi:hypothetical protein